METQTAAKVKAQVGAAVASAVAAERRPPRGGGALDAAVRGAAVEAAQRATSAKAAAVDCAVLDGAAAGEGRGRRRCH